MPLLAKSLEPFLSQLQRRENEHHHHTPAAACTNGMTFTWAWRDSCVVFEWWQVSTMADFLFTMAMLVALGAGYEWLKLALTEWERNGAYGAIGLLNGDAPSNPAETNATNTPLGRLLLSLRTKRAVGYAVQTAYAFMLMLVFMSYSGWFMLATVMGAGLGNFIWGSTETEGRALACH